MLLPAITEVKRQVFEFCTCYGPSRFYSKIYSLTRPETIPMLHFLIDTEHHSSHVPHRTAGKYLSHSEVLSTHFAQKKKARHIFTWKHRPLAAITKK